MSIGIAVLFLHIFILRHNRAPRPRYRPVELEIQLCIQRHEERKISRSPALVFQRRLLQAVVLCVARRNHA